MSSGAGGVPPLSLRPVPEDQCEEIKDVSPFVTYGWGMIPAEVRIGGTESKTLFSGEQPFHDADQGPRKGPRSSTV